MHVDHRRRGRVAEGAGRRVLAVRAHAGAARGADGSARAAERRAGALPAACSATVRFERRFAASVAAGAARPRADAPRDHQPRRQRHRGDERPLGALIVLETQHDRRRTAWSGSSSPTTGRVSRRPSARSCSCRTIRPNAAAAASAWPSSAASSPSTAAASRSATTCRAARDSPSNCHAEFVVSNAKTPGREEYFSKDLATRGLSCDEPEFRRHLGFASLRWEPNGRD